jgi:acetyl esterase
MPLNPDMSVFLDKAKAAGAVEISTLTPQQARLSTHATLDLIGEINKSVSITHLYMTGPTADLPLEIFTPPGVGPFNALVWFHGGGWVVNFLSHSHSHLTELATRTNSVIIAVNYQKAPEHKFPIPHDDCYAALEWTLQNANKLNIDPTKVGVGGDSAGGNLASGVAIRARDENKISLNYQLLLYPCNGLDFETISYKECATGYGLTRSDMKWFWEKYLNGGQDLTNPYAVPLSCSDLKGVAPAIIATVEFDVLRDDGVNYAKLLTESGVPVVYKDFPGLIHGCYSFSGVAPSALVLRDFFAESVNGLLQKDS